MKVGWARKILKECFPRALPGTGCWGQPWQKKFTLFRAGVSDSQKSQPKSAACDLEEDSI